jgi:phage terminase large subunit-like protein
VAVQAALDHKADCIVAERNFGGDMVEHVIRTAAKELGVIVRVKLVNASRGKMVRAEPVAALYEQGKVGHAGMFAKLEDQLCDFTPQGYEGQGSPDRADAAIWGLTELMLGAAAATYEGIPQNQIARSWGNRGRYR